MNTVWIELLRRTRYLWLVGISVLLGFSAAFIHPMSPIAAVIGGAVVITGIRQPFVLLAVFTLLLYTRITDLHPVLMAMQLTKMLVLLALGTTLLSKLLRRDYTWAQSDHNLYIILLTMVALLSCMISTDRSTSFAFFNENFVKIVIIYFLIINLVDSPARMVQYQLVICSACVFLGLYANYSVLTGTNLVEGSRVVLGSFLDDPNDFAFVMLTSIPFLLVATLEHKGKARFVYGIALLIVLSGFLHTQSRGGLLGLLVACFFIFKDRIRNKALLTATITSMALLAVLLGGIQQRQIGSLSLSGVDESTQSRFDTWEAGLRMFYSSPIFGLGFNRFSVSYESFAVNPSIWGVLDAHNTYIKVAAETGILGLIPFLMLVYLSLRNAVHYWKPEKTVLDPLQRAVLRSLLPNMVAILVAAFFLSQSWIWYLYIQMAMTATLPQCFELPDQSRTQ